MQSIGMVETQGDPRKTSRIIEMDEAYITASLKRRGAMIGSYVLEGSLGVGV